MTALRQIIDGFFRWIDSVATTIVAMAGWSASRRLVQITEQDPTTLVMRTGGKSPIVEPIAVSEGEVVAALPEKSAALLRGSRAELVLKSDHFLFRPLDLPKRAGEFLDGIVRAQIDRLTPWTAGEALYKWTAPVAIAGDRITMTVAATARAAVAPLLEAVADVQAAAIAVGTAQ